MSSTASRRGRRPGSPDTRTAILVAARERFGESGFDRTTIRAIAGEAGVDPALVHHYFGSKDDLFVAALELPVDPRVVIAERVIGPSHGDPEGAGERFLRAFVSVWDDDELQPALLALIRRVLEPGGDKLIREGFLPVVLIPFGEKLGIDRPEVRMPFVASQVIGMVMARYVVRVEPIASMDADQLAEVYGPVLQRYLTGPMPDLP